MKTHTVYELAASMVKPKGLKGEIVVAAPDNLPLRLYEGLDLWIVPPTLEGVRVTQVTSLRTQTKEVLVTLEGVSDANAARALSGRYLLARAEDLTQACTYDGGTGQGQFTGKGSHAGFATAVSATQILSELVGCSVEDVDKGFVGTINRIEDNPAHPLLVLDGAQGMVLIPYVEEFIIEHSETVLRVQLPAGLIELNQRTIEE